MPRNELAAVLWDMDGTIIDSEPLWLGAEQAMLERFGVPLTAEARDRLVGTGLWDAARQFQAMGVAMSADSIVAEWVESVSQGLAEVEPAWRPGARELLLSLSEAGLPCALVTMSVRSLAEQVIAKLPPGLFDVIIAGDEVTHAKPHPEPYLRAAAALGTRIEDCLVIEDSPTGLRSAAAAGAIAIGVPNLVPLDAAPAHALWSTLSGIDAAQLSAEFRAHRGD